VLGVDAPAVVLQAVSVEEPVEGPPGAALRGHVPAERDARAVVVVAVVAAGHAMAGGRAHEHDAAVAEELLGRVVRAVGAAVVGGLVAFEQRVVGAREPEAVRAVVGLVAQVGVAGIPGLEAVVVGPRAVVLDEHVARAGPAVEAAQEDAVAAVGHVVAHEVVVVGPALEEHAGRVAGVDLARVNAQAPREIVVGHHVAAARPELEADVRAVREGVAGDPVAVAAFEVEAVPHPLGGVAAQHAVRQAGEHEAAEAALDVPARGRVGEVVREIAVLDEPARAVARGEADAEAAHLQAAQRHARTALGHDARALERLGLARAARPGERRPVAVNGHAACGDDERLAEHGPPRQNRVLGDSHAFSPQMPPV